MKDLTAIFGESPFTYIVEHARKIHECVALIRPIADAILTRDMEKLHSLQKETSRLEEESDAIKDSLSRPPLYWLEPSSESGLPVDLEPSTCPSSGRSFYPGSRPSPCVPRFPLSSIWE